MALFLVGTVAVFFIAMFARSLLTLFFSLENYSVHKRRLQQLQFAKKKEDMDLSGLIDTVTKPVISHVFSRFKPKRLEELEKDLRMAKWDKNFTPIQYRALSILLKTVGIVLFIVFSNFSMFLAVIWGVVLFFGVDLLFKNSVINRREKLFNDFPDFIRVTEGYLTANIPFTKAVEESIKYVGDEWKPILQRFVVESEIKGIEEGLDMLKREVDLFEMREFVSLVKLTLEQGGEAKDGFSAQAEKIREMQMDLIAVKISKRQTMGVLIQGPLLLCILMVVGLPTVNSMLSLNSL